jgi:hypothetical protein
MIALWMTTSLGSVTTIFARQTGQRIDVVASISVVIDD